MYTFIFTCFISPLLSLLIFPKKPSIFGRIFSGILADKIGRFNVMILTALLSSITGFAIWIPGRAAGYEIVFAGSIGFLSGAFLSLFPSCITQISAMPEIGTRTGLSFSVISLGTLIGGPIAGAIVDRMGGNYLGLQIFFGVSMFVSALLFYAARWVQAGSSLRVMI